MRTVDARPMRTSRLFDTLPPYLGGKRRLAPLILADLAAELPPAEWPGAFFCDPMCGGGAVALAAKAQGFEVYASDRARRGAIVAAALIANSSVRLREADWLPALRADDLRANGAAAVSVFTAAQARRIDGLLTAAAARQAPTRALLELLAIKLVCRLFPMSLPDATDAARAAAGEYDTISPRRLVHYLRRDRWIQPAGLRTLATAINGGVIGGRGHATQRDAREAIAASPAEVIYLDPPYPGTTDYGAYGLLDTLLGDDLPAAPAPRLADLLDAAVAAPIVILSYGGPHRVWTIRRISSSETATTRLMLSRIALSGSWPKTLAACAFRLLFRRVLISPTASPHALPFGAPWARNSMLPPVSTRIALPVASSSRLSYSSPTTSQLASQASVPKPSAVPGAPRNCPGVPFLTCCIREATPRRLPP